MNKDNKYLQIIKGASYKQRKEFSQIKKPHVKIAYERYIKKNNNVSKPK